MRMTLKGGGYTKDVDAGSRRVAMYLSVFGNEDADGDVMRRGAYARSIREWGPEGKNRIWFLTDHDYTKRVTKFDTLEEDDTGLYAEATLPDTTLANDLLTLYRELGESIEHSVGFHLLDRSSENEKEIISVKLWEGSMVTWGANDMAQSMGLKSFGDHAATVEEAAQRHVKRLRSLLREGMSDAAMERIERQVDIYDTQLSALTEARREKASITGDGGPGEQQRSEEKADACDTRKIERLKHLETQFAAALTSLRLPTQIGDRNGSTRTH